MARDMVAVRKFCFPGIAGNVGLAVRGFTTTMHAIDDNHGTPGVGSNKDTRSKLRDLEALLGSWNHAGVAFSGGVDSTLLLAVAVKVMRDRAVAFTAVSPSLPSHERREVKRLAEELGVEHHEIETDELSDSRYRDNGPDRCFFCKTHLFTMIIDEARRRGIDVVLDGSNADDVNDYRPGMKATRMLHVRSPFMEVGLTKPEIRDLARAMKLRVWDKPATPCLASRIPYHSPVTRTKLDQIDRAEQFMRELGFRVVRVRHHGDEARVEVEPDRVASLNDPAMRERVNDALRRIGFARVSIDPEGYCPGKLNRALDDR